MAQRSRTWIATPRRQSTVADLVYACLALGLGTVWPLIEGIDAGTILLIVGASTLGGIAVGFLPNPWLVVGYLAGVAATAATSVALDFGPHEWTGCILGFYGGCVGGRYFRDRRHPATPSSPPPSPAPSTHRSQLIREDGGEQDEVIDPEVPDVLSAVRKLDGRRRTTVTLVRGTSRLDVAGEAAGALMVYHCDERDDHRAIWYHVTTPGGGDDEVEVPVAGVVGWFPARLTCRLDAAERAARYYLATGGRDPDLPWHGGHEVADMRPSNL